MQMDSGQRGSVKEAASTSGKVPETAGIVPRDESVDDSPPPATGTSGGAPTGKVESAPEVKYFASELLTVRPYPLTVLENPEGMEKVPDDLSGKVVLKVWISDTGEVSATEIELAEMPLPHAEAMASAFRRMRFMPGEIDGKRVGCIMRIEMTYEDFRLPVM